MNPIILINPANTQRQYVTLSITGRTERMVRVSTGKLGRKPTRTDVFRLDTRREALDFMIAEAKQRQERGYKTVAL